MTYLVTALDGLAFGLLLFTVAAGLALIFGVMNVLNLAHGSLYLAGAYLAWLLGGKALPGLVTALAAGLVIGAAAGAVLGAAIRPLAATGHLDQALATLGVAFLAADGYAVAFGAAPLPVNPPEPLAGSVTLAGRGYPLYRLVFVGVTALLAAALHWTVTRSRYGILLRATVADPVMAAATGINTRRVQTAAMAGGAALAVAAGVLGAPLLGPAPGVDAAVLVLSLIVVAIGGSGSIPKTLAAAVLVGQVQTVGVLAASTLAPFVLFAVLMAVLALRARAEPVVRPS